jgi:hypothetical protein
MVLAAPEEVEQMSSAGSNSSGIYNGLLTELKETVRRRDDLIRPEVRLTLQIKSICRRVCSRQCPDFDTDAKRYAWIKKEGRLLYTAIMKGQQHEMLSVGAPACFVLLQVRAQIHSEILPVERRLKELAQKLPVWDWWDSVHGLGALGLAAIVAETGDLSNYANPGKVWKRMGVAVINGERQRKKKGAEALEHGYSPRRRSTIWVVSDSLLKKPNEYKELYDWRKAEQAEKWPERKKGHLHNDARRYVGKRLLKHLWRAWRRTCSDDQICSAPGSPE